MQHTLLDCDSQVFVNSIIISLSVLAERPVQDVLSCYPVLGILSLVSCAVPAHIFFYFVLIEMTSHNTYCLFHLQKTKRGAFCPITAVLMAVLSFVLDILDVLDVLLCLIHHICPTSSVFT